MKKKISKLGMILAGTYLFMSLGLYIYSTICHETFCGLIAIFAVLPWNFILEKLIWLPYSLRHLLDSYFGYWIIVIINAIILYFIGKLISRFVSRKNNQTNVQ